MKYLQEEKIKHLLYLPNLTTKMYTDYHHQYIWLGNPNFLLLNQALSLLDDAGKYGLYNVNYHSKQLNAENINHIKSERVLQINDFTKQAIEVLLTDALLAFISHLHFGKINPKVTLKDIDKPEEFKDFRVDSVLKLAIQNLSEFKQIILSAQPHSHEYRLLQEYLSLAVNEHQSTGYTLVSDTLKRITLNMERHKWSATPDSVSVTINIPSFTLQFKQKETIDEFKVIIGKPSTPSPLLLKSKIDYFTTAPSWTPPYSIFTKELLPSSLNNSSYLAKNHLTIYTHTGKPLSATSANLKMVRSNPSAYFMQQSPGAYNALGKIVFRFKNQYGIYLHDTPNRKLFDKTYRALSHGCIRLDQPEKFVNLLLRGDGATETTQIKVADAMKNYKKMHYHLQKPIPIIVQYITCAIKNGVPVFYPDLYQQDKKLAKKLLQNY